MPEFILNEPVKTEENIVEVTINPENPLPVGRHRFRLVVTDEAGNVSAPDEVDVIVRDTRNPTAVLDAPKAAEYGESFNLSGSRSSDVPPGRVVSYEWTMVPAPERPVVVEGPVIIGRTPTVPGDG